VERQAARSLQVQLLPELSSDEQLSLLCTFESANLARCLSWAIEDPAAEGIAAISATWLANGKAVMQEALTHQARLLRNAPSEEDRERMRELSEVRRELSQFALFVPPSGRTSQIRQQIAYLSKRDAELSRAMPFARRNNGPEEWITVGQVRAAVPEDAVLVDIARFHLYDFGDEPRKTRWREPVYVAWVVPPAGGGTVQIVNLGPAEPIDQAIQQTRRAINSTLEETRELGEIASEESIRKKLESLTDQIFNPIRERMRGVSRLILCPDGDLWLVPWAALPVTNNRYLIEDLEISYIVSARDLVNAPQETQGRIRAALVVADPDFDLPVGDAIEEQRSFFGPEYVEPKRARWEAISSRGQLSKADRLPGTADEAKAVLPDIASHTGAEPNVLLDARAQEALAKATISPRLALFSTHGFFLKDQTIRPSNPKIRLANAVRSVPATVDGDPLQNPLLRCGLLLAGCNRSNEAIAAGIDDGILTGMEVACSDLRGTELVILSACDTGVGVVQNGQGVAGLRQAFQLAGAQCVVATLWKIPDPETPKLMADFFQYLAAGQTHSEALCSAQRARIATRRKLHGAAHPFFWAAFTLTGQ
jgi:CHAT domain-containing protein